MSSWNEFCQSVKRVANQAADKIGQTADLATLQVRLSVAEHKLEEAYAELGRLTYQQRDTQPTDQEKADLANAIKTVGTRFAECQDLKKQIEDAKAAGKGSDTTNGTDGQTNA